MFIWASISRISSRILFLSSNTNTYAYIVTVPYNVMCVRNDINIISARDLKVRALLDARAKVKRNRKKWYERKIVPTVVVEKLHEKVMNGNVTFVGLNFQGRVEEEHLKKEGNNGEARAQLT